MGAAYTPGLRVTSNAPIRRERRLPTKGEVLVIEGQIVSADEVVARAEMPGNLHTVRAAQTLHVEPQELEGYLLKRPGEKVEAGEVIAETKGMWGLFRTAVKAPIAGVLEDLSAVSGHVRIREAPRRVEVLAHIAGRVEGVISGEGAALSARAALVQGIFGIGGERRGHIKVLCSERTARLRAEDIRECAGCVIVAGAGADTAAIRAAAEAGAVGLVVGAVRDEIVREYLGYDIGVAITGQEDVPLTLILSEGFGELAMAQRTWDLLSSLEGQLASIDGATQIRAGVIRPEVIVTHEAADPDAAEAEPEQILDVGSRVRVIREPHFGALGRVSQLPPHLTEIETESKVRIAMVQLDTGDEARVPRANLEIIQE